MHIAMLSAEYPPRWGGMGSTVFHLSSALVSRGHKVTVITRNGGGTDIPTIDGIEVISVGWMKLPMEFTRSYGRSALRALKKLNQSKPVDVVHLHCPMISWNKNQFDDCKTNIAPVVSSLHGSWLGEKDGLITAAKQKEAAVWANPNDLAILLTAKRYAKFENAAIRNSNVCVANSEATKIDFLERYSAPENWDCEVIHWGVDTDMFTPAESFDKTLRMRFGCSDDGILLLAVGRLAARKGYGSLLKAFAIVNSECPESRLVIVGRGHLRTRLLKQAKKLGLSSSVHIESSMSFSELAKLFRNADLTVYPSYYEGQGLIPLESMSSGTPVVTVDHGPLPEMVDSTVGALFAMGDIDSMSSTILHEIKNKKILESKGIEGRKRVIEKFTYEIDANSFLRIYNRL
ncbi:MAG: glycosyltransferase family 4 protein [Candidatus Poseidoniales archaeon]|jgi:glycosyltransferase involved in cell wall biosynthesis|tara:strand:- start:1546 stop:2754 length:1209 start_codon:yes stop_codon:yes gene_type:complete